jgi:hypothetical protein
MYFFKEAKDILEKEHFSKCRELYYTIKPYIIKFKNTNDHRKRNAFIKEMLNKNIEIYYSWCFHIVKKAYEDEYYNEDERLIGFMSVRIIRILFNYLFSITKDYKYIYYKFDDGGGYDNSDAFEEYIKYFDKYCIFNIIDPKYIELLNRMKELDNKNNEN